VARREEKQAKREERGKGGKRRNRYLKLGGTLTMFRTDRLPFSFIFCSLAKLMPFFGPKIAFKTCSA